MKKTFFAGKFNKTIIDGKLSLIKDYRVPLAGNEERFTFANEGNAINEDYYYIGTFYNEKASNGQLTSSDCKQVVEAELKLIDNCDLFCAYLDSETELSLGTVVELIYATTIKKEILIFYNKKEVGYDVKSEYWYPIIATEYLQEEPEKITIVEINDVKQIYEYLDKGNTIT